MELKNIDFLKLYHNYEYKAYPFNCFIRTGPFVSLKHYPNFTLDYSIIENKEYPSKLYEVINSYDFKSTLIILDMPGDIAILEAYYLNNINSIKPIPIFNFLLHQNGLIGNKSFVNNLVVVGNKLTDIEPKGFMILLDYNRFGDFTEKQYEEGFNNQYELFDEDIPSIDMLKELGYSTIVYISQDKEKEDIANYLNYLEENDIEVKRVLDFKEAKKV